MGLLALLMWLRYRIYLTAPYAWAACICTVITFSLILNWLIPYDPG